MLTQSNHHLRGILFASVACILWGISGVCASTLFLRNTSLSAIWVTEIRMLVAGMILLGWAQIVGKYPVKIWQQGRSARQVVSYGLLGLIPFQLCYFEAVRVGNAPIATIIQFLGPFIVSFYFLLFKHVRPSRLELVGMGLAFVGTVLIVTHGQLNQLAISPAVLFWGGLSAVGVATNTLLPRPLLPKYGTLTVTGWGLLVAGMCLMFVQPVWRQQIDFSGFDWGMLAVIVLLGTVAPFLMFARSLNDILPTTASLLDAFEPLSATVFSVIFLSTQLTRFDFWGGALIIVAVMALSVNLDWLMHRWRNRV